MEMISYVFLLMSTCIFFLSVKMKEVSSVENLQMCVLVLLFFDIALMPKILVLGANYGAD